MPIVTLHDTLSRFTAERTAARERPPVRCAICGKLDCLDIPGERICDYCIEAREAAARERDRLETIRRRISASGLPEGFHDVGFETVHRVYHGGTPRAQNIAAIDAAKQTILQTSPSACGGTKGGPKGLMLYGETGLGKTLLLAAVVRAWAEQGVTPTYLNAAELMDDFEQRRFNEARDPIRELRGDPVIILDDLTFDAPPNEFIRRKFYLIFETVYATGGTTLYIASNLPLSTANGGPSIQKFIDPLGRVTRRIKQNCRVLHLTGRDLNLEKP